MAGKKKKRSSGKTFRFQLSLGGIVGIAVVSFCLFLWMFLLGIWAGQTILLPAARPAASKGAISGTAAAGSKSPAQPLATGARTRPAEKGPQR